jgi:hypothetical protein
MGKASRMKKVHRMAMADRPKWQAEAPRQARERRDEAVNQHNASLEEKMEKFNALGGNDVILIDNGVRYVGKEKIRAVFNSWVCNELERDDPSQLGDIAAMGSLLKSTIWEVKVEIINLATGEPQYVNPLYASYVLGQVKCFAWLLDHAVANPQEGDKLMAEIIEEVISLRYQFDLSSARWTSASLLLKTVFDLMGDDMLEEHVRLNCAIGGTDPVDSIAKECLAKTRARLERLEFESSTPIPDDGLLVVANPHAIGLGLESENDAIYAGKSRRQVGSTAKRL